MEYIEGASLNGTTFLDHGRFGSVAHVNTSVIWEIIYVRPGDYSCFVSNGGVSHTT